jgi:hydrogenase assembly chaperone HypC/HupF
MCLDTVGRVIDIDGDVAQVAFGGVRRSISLVLLRADEVAVGPGDWLRTHTGLAVERMDPYVAEALAAEAGVVRNEVEW